MTPALTPALPEALTSAVAPPVPESPPDGLLHGSRDCSPVLPTGLLAGEWQRLTDDDATRIAAAVAATHAEATRTAYAHAWSHWCAGRGLVGFPAEPAAVCAYLTERADHGVSFSTIELACSAIGYQHRRHAVPDPLDHPTVRQVRRGLRRLLGTAPRRPARPLRIEELRQIIASIDRGPEGHGPPAACSWVSSPSSRTPGLGCG